MKSARARTASWTGSDPSPARCSCFRARISCASLPRAGSSSRRQAGRHFLLGTASLSTLTYEHGHPVIGLWNDTRHVSTKCLEESK